MQIINDTVNAIFDALFSAIGKDIGLAVLSLLIGVFVAVSYRYCADQGALKRVNDRIKSYIYELRLFDYSPALVLGALGNIFRYSGLYLLQSLRPFAVFILPVVVILVQLHYLFDYRPLRPGGETLVTIEFINGFLESGEEYSLKIPDFVSVDGTHFENRETGTVAFRLRILDYGTGALGVEAGGRTAVMRLVVSESSVTACPAAASGGFLTRLLYFGADYLPADSPVRSIEVQYGSGGLPVFGLSLHWLIWLILISSAAAIILMKRWKVNW